MNTIVYIGSYCPYCHMVQNFIEENNIEVVFKNRSDSDVKQELIELGGKPQVPYLHDEKTGAKMYESQDIINYLGETYL